METDDPSAPAGEYPRWILLQLEHYGRSQDPADDDRRTVAHARTSRGQPISVSLVLAAPPATSRLHVHSPSLPDGLKIHSSTVAAHGDSVLVNIQTSSSSGDASDCDYFIYCAAADPLRPPSLTLLPPCYLAGGQDQEGKPKHKHYRNLYTDRTALLRRGQDDVLVALLDFNVKEGEDRSGPLEAELCLLRSGEWELMRLPVIHDDGKKSEVSSWWTDSVIPVEDRYLLWVDYFRGIIFSDVWQNTPELRYASLPVEPEPWKNNDRSSSRRVCATHGGAAVRFVEVFPRCCCGRPGDTRCAVSWHAFTVTTWALNMDDMATWDKVSVVDCDELWSLPGCHGVVPRIKPNYAPTMSLDDPDILCFRVDKSSYDTHADGDLGTWLIDLDTRRMELRSVLYYKPEFYLSTHCVVSAVSHYFDPSPCSRTPNQTDLEVEASVRSSKLTLPRAASSGEMLATMREIPDLTHDDILKAYGVLASDESQFMFRSLLALPVDMRKDYCILMGKLSCFDV